MRQYYIRPEFWRQCLGIQGISLVKTNRFKSIKTIIIDVVVGKQRGMNFWKKVGFEKHIIKMKTRGRYKSQYVD